MKILNLRYLNYLLARPTHCTLHCYMTFWVKVWCIMLGFKEPLIHYILYYFLLWERPRNVYINNFIIIVFNAWTFCKGP